MKGDIERELQDTFNKLTWELSSLSGDQLNQVPFSGGWTAAQVGDHLVSSYGIVMLLEGNTAPTSRPVDEKAREIKEMFLDFSIQMESPDFILPSEEFIFKEVLIQELEQKTGLTLKCFTTRDLSVTCLDFEVPVFGALTGWEWMHFITYHTQRHLHQLEKIKKGLINKTVNG